MNLAHVIIGPVVTEKAERLKTQGTYVLRVKPEATKVDVKNALRTYYDVDAASVRALRTAPKTKIVGQGSSMEKRHRTKRMIIRLTKKSKALDLTSYRSS